MDKYLTLLREYREFQKETLTKEKEEIYSMVEEILFYSNIMDYLENEEPEEEIIEKIKSLEDMYKFYMEDDIYYVRRREDIQAFIEEYITSLEEN